MTTGLGLKRRKNGIWRGHGEGVDSGSVGFRYEYDWIGCEQNMEGKSARKSSSGCCCQEKMSPSFPLDVVDVCFWTMGTPMPIKTRATTRKGNVTERHTAFPA